MNDQRYIERQQKIKQKVEERVAAAQKEKGLFLLITGKGKGKSTAGFGMITRATGHQQKCGVAQFIKGNWPCAERHLLQKCGVEFHVMATGFTWDTQNKQFDKEAAQQVWQQCKRMLLDASYDVILLDEITYMITYDYIDLHELIKAIQNRPKEQSVILTGRGAHRSLIEIADTVSEIRNIKHAFDDGIKARKGIDW